MSQQVLTGIDVLQRSGFRQLRSQRIGLVTNHTGLNIDGLATADLLHTASKVILTALFGPEHGIRGEYDETVADGIDSKTGLPVYSLYGNRFKPTAHQLADLDTLVYDIQDIGCRFYTYISTLGYILEAASENNKRVVVLDRPNPITGLHCEGPITDLDKFSFTSYTRLPVRHGMTVGELAQLFHREKGLRCDLEVIPCEGWRRSQWFDETGLVWTNPSPNMRALTQATLYPGVGLLEFTNLSVGRGTDTPFEVAGAPFIEPRTFAAALNDASVPGIRCIPIYFTPTASKCQGKRCGGVNFVVTDRESFDSVLLGMTLATTLRRLYPDDWEPERYLRPLAHQVTFDHLLAGDNASTLVSRWTTELTDFMGKRQSHLIYE